MRTHHYATFTDQEAQRLRMAQALESTEQVPDEVATRVTQRVMHQVNPDADPKGFLLLRAQGILDWARQEKYPLLKEPATVSLAWFFMLFAVAFALGVVVDKFTHTDNTLNLLSPPLLGWVLWNVLVYVILGVGTLKHLFAKHPSARWGRQTLTQGLEWILAHSSALLNRSASQITYLKWRLTDKKTHLLALAALMMHGMALFFTLGIITNVLFLGLGNEWRVGWESTWIQDPHTLNTLLYTLYGWVPGLGPWPEMSTITQLHLTSQDYVSTQAGPWLIRLLGLLTLIVVVPRFILLLLNLWGVRRTTKVRLDLSNWNPLIRGCHADERWMVINASTYPTQEAVAPLMRLSPHPFEELRFNPWTDHQDDLVRALRGTQPLFAVMLFNASDTPEEEVHGLVLEAVKTYGHPEHRAPAIALITPEGRTLMPNKKQAWDAFGVSYGANVLVLSESPATLDAWRTLLDVG